MLSLYYILQKKKKKVKLNKLEFNPQQRGIVMQTRILTPKKPNSARRPIVKVNLMNLNILLAYIPGIGHNLKKHSMVLIRGGRTRDLPSMYYKCIRGVFDLIFVQGRMTRRSIYGVKLFENLKKKIRRKFRQN